MKRTFTKEEQSIIKKEYLENKRGLLYTSKRVKSSPETIKKYLREQGVKIRTFSEATTATNKNRALNKNKNYFQTENENMAWVLGFLASDGTIRKDRNQIKIGLSQIDKEILEKIKQEIEIENDVKDYVSSNGFSCSQLSWTCQEHKQDLAKYSIVPEKTFTLKPPYLLQKKYWVDYIRGYFDGDGSINTNGENGLRFSICGATKEILQWIIDFFYEEYRIPKVNILIDKNKVYYFAYSTNATKQIYKILYSTNSNLFLQRKKDKFEKLLLNFN